MEEGMILFGQDIAGTGQFKVVKVPEVVYQIFYDLAQQRHNRLEQRQRKIFKELCVWVDEAHPGWGIQNFIDLSNTDCKELNFKHAFNNYLEWGMYVLIQQGVPHIKIIPQVKQIEDNATTDHAIRNE